MFLSDVTQIADCPGCFEQLPAEMIMPRGFSTLDQTKNLDCPSCQTQLTSRLDLTLNLTPNGININSKVRLSKTPPDDTL